MFESVDNQYNWLGIDDSEAKKLSHPHVMYDQHMPPEMMHSHEDCGNPQDRSNLFVDAIGSSILDYHEGGMSQNLIMSKNMPQHSEEIIAVNDSDNEVIVPEDMEVQHLDDHEHHGNIY